MFLNGEEIRNLRRRIRKNARGGQSYEISCTESCHADFDTIFDLRYTLPWDNNRSSKNLKKGAVCTTLAKRDISSGKSVYVCQNEEGTDKKKAFTFTLYFFHMSEMIFLTHVSHY